MLRDLLTQIETKEGIDPSLQAKILESIEQEKNKKKPFYYWPGIAAFSSLLVIVVLNVTQQDDALPLTSASTLLRGWNEVIDGTFFGPGSVVHVKSSYESIDPNGETKMDFEFWTDGKRFASRSEDFMSDGGDYQVALALPKTNGYYDHYYFSAPKFSTDCKQVAEELCFYEQTEIESTEERVTPETLLSYDLYIPEEIINCLEQTVCDLTHVLRDDSLDGKPMKVVSISKERDYGSSKKNTEISEYWFDAKGLPVQFTKTEGGYGEIETFEVTELDESEAPLTLESWNDQLLGINASLSPQP